MESLDIGEVHIDPANMRKHSDRNRGLVRSSLGRFGPGRSIVLDGKNVCRAGNTTIEQARQAGFKRVLVVEPGPDEIVAVRRPEWTDTEGTAYSIMDNRSTEFSEWEAELPSVLDALGVDGIAPIDLGFNEVEYSALISTGAADDASDHDGGADGTKGQGLEAIREVIRSEPKTEVIAGDVMRLGRHILICADVMRDWPEWSKHLTPDSLFCPYPSPFLSLADTEKTFVMVQPDPYLCSLACDLWAAANPGEEVVR